MKNLLLSFFLLTMLWVTIPQSTQAKGSGIPIELNGVKLSDAYPNPANSYVNFDYSLELGVRQARLEIFNVIGEVVVSEELDNQFQSAKISLDDIKKGVYFYRLVVDGKKSNIKKLIIQ